MIAKALALLLGERAPRQLASGLTFRVGFPDHRRDRCIDRRSVRRNLGICGFALKAQKGPCRYCNDSGIGLRQLGNRRPGVDAPSGPCSLGAASSSLPICRCIAQYRRASQFGGRYHDRPRKGGSATQHQPARLGGRTDKRTTACLDQKPVLRAFRRNLASCAQPFSSDRPHARMPR
jgi:hypothetical protein